MRSWRFLVTSLAGGLVLNCSTSASRARDLSGRSEPPNTIITAAELSRYAPNETLMTAVRRLRPWFLGTRGSIPMVIIDSSPAMELSVLETLLVSDVSDVRLLRASSSPGRPAFTSSGSVVVGDVLLVRTTGRKPTR